MFFSHCRSSTLTVLGLVFCSAASVNPKGSDFPPATDPSSCSVTFSRLLCVTPSPLGVHSDGSCFCVPFSVRYPISSLLSILFVSSPLVPPVLSACHLVTIPPVTITGAGPHENSATLPLASPARSAPSTFFSSFSSFLTTPGSPWSFFVLMCPAAWPSLLQPVPSVSQPENSAMTFLSRLPAPYSPLAVCSVQDISVPAADPGTALPVFFSFAPTSLTPLVSGSHSNLPSASVWACFVPPPLLYLLGDLATHFPSAGTFSVASAPGASASIAQAATHAAAEPRPAARIPLIISASLALIPPARKGGS